MYPGYNAQQAMQDARVRELVEHVQPDEAPKRRLPNFFAALRERLVRKQTERAPEFRPMRGYKVSADR